MASYTTIDSDDKFMDIMEYLFQQTAPVTGSQVAGALNLKHATVMSHIATAVERKWVRLNGDRYEPGPRIAGMYAAWKRGVEEAISRLQGELDNVEGR